MKILRTIVIGLLVGFLVIILSYGAYTVGATPTGKVSASLISYSTFTQIVMALVIFMAFVVYLNARKKNRII